MNAPRMGHQDRTYNARLLALRKRLERAKTSNPALSGVMAGVLDVLADLVADQEEAERSK